MVYFVFIFSFLWDSLLKNLFGFVLLFSFHFYFLVSQKKKDLNAKIKYNFLAFSFSKNEYSVIFVKKSNS